MDVDTGNVALTIELTTPACPVKEMFQRQATQFVKVGACVCWHCMPEHVSLQCQFTRWAKGKSSTWTSP